MDASGALDPIVVFVCRVHGYLGYDDDCLECRAVQANADGRLDPPLPWADGKIPEAVNIRATGA